MNIRSHIYGLILIPLILGACKKSSTDPCTPGLNLIAEYELGISQPSGLSLYEDGKLLSVSDQTGMAYVISTEGVLHESFSLTGNDLEGVYFSNADQVIYHVDESTGNLHATDTDITLISSTPIIAPDGNQGLEGCTMNPITGTIYLLKERSPGILIQYDVSSGDLQSFTLDFSEDYSGIAYKESTDELYIISDASKALSICSITGTELARYNLCIDKAEGIALDEQQGLIYIVSDKTEVLYVFEMP